MDITCKNCGGDVKILSQDGDSVKVKCTCCGSVYTHSLAPKVRSAPSQSEPARSKSEPARSAHDTANEMAGEDIYDRNIKAVVEITTEDGRASGYFISQNGVIMTNTHAVTDSNGNANKRISVRVDGKTYPAKVIALGDDKGGSGNGIDLALVIADGPMFQSVTLGSSAKVRNGEQVYYIGNSRGEGSCITGGIVSDRDRMVGSNHYIMTDAATNPGNSGGPLINKNGEVIGTHVSARNDAVGMKYAIPIDSGKQFIAEVARQAGIPVSSLCDCPLSPSKESFGLVWSGMQLIVEGVLFLKDIISLKRKKYRKDSIDG